MRVLKDLQVCFKLAFSVDCSNAHNTLRTSPELNLETISKLEYLIKFLIAFTNSSISPISSLPISFISLPPILALISLTISLTNRTWSAILKWLSQLKFLMNIPSTRSSPRLTLYMNSTILWLKDSSIDASCSFNMRASSPRLASFHTSSGVLSEWTEKIFRNFFAEFNCWWESWSLRDGSLWVKVSGRVRLSRIFLSRRD